MKLISIINSRIGFFAIGLIGLFMSYMYLSDIEVIVNANHLYVLYSIIICFMMFSILFLFIKYEKIKKSLFQIIASLFFLSWPIGLTPILFYYRNIVIESKNGKDVVLKCDIIGMSTFARNKKIFYKYESHNLVLYGYDSIMEKISRDGSYSDYVLRLNCHQSSSGYLVISSWSIIPRPTPRSGVCGSRRSRRSLAASACHACRLRRSPPPAGAIGRPAWWQAGRWWNEE
jgi:hypothetical protein